MGTTPNQHWLISNRVEAVRDVLACTSGVYAALGERKIGSIVARVSAGEMGYDDAVAVLDAIGRRAEAAAERESRRRIARYRAQPDLDRRVALG